PKSLGPKFPNLSLPNSSGKAMASKRRFPIPLWLAVFLLLTAGLAVEVLLLRQSGGSRVSRFTILQINDVYRIEGLDNRTVGGLARVRTIRRTLEAQGSPVLLLHAGDFLYPSVLSREF